MKYGEVVSIETKLKPRAGARTQFAKQGLVVAMHASANVVDLAEHASDKEANAAVKRIDRITVSILDELSAAGYEREALFLFGVCKNIAEAGGSDAEIGHTAFEFIKLFPEVREAVDMRAAADDIAFRNRSKNISA